MASRAKPSPAQADVFDAPPPEVKNAPTAQQTIKDSHGLIASANALTVSNAAEYTSAADVLQNLRGAFKRLEEERFSITRPIDAAKDRIMAFFKPHSDAVEAAGKIVKGKMNDYDAEQRRIAEEARIKAEAEARAERERIERKAREERERAEAKARAEREEAERKRREQEEAERRAREQREAEERAARQAAEAKARGDAAAARKAQEDADRAAAARKAEEEAAAAAQREAQKAEAKAERTEERAEARVQQLDMQAAMTVAPVIQQEVAKVSGIARKLVWKYRVKDPAKVKREFLALDEQKIAKLVKAMGKDAETMVGEGAIECWQENDIAARAK